LTFCPLFCRLSDNLCTVDVEACCWHKRELAIVPPLTLLGIRLGRLWNLVHGFVFGRGQLTASLVRLISPPTQHSQKKRPLFATFFCIGQVRGFFTTLINGRFRATHVWPGDITSQVFTPLSGGVPKAAVWGNRPGLPFTFHYRRELLLDSLIPAPC